MEIAFVIPIRGLTTSMSRLRDDLAEEKVNKIVKKLLLHTIEICQQFDHEIIVVTADKNIHKLTDEISIEIDEGNDLNLALIQVIEEYPNIEKFFLIMPDLPGLEKKHLERMLHLSQFHPYVITNTEDAGTACAILKPEFYHQQLFGERSFEKLLDFAKDQEIPLANLQISELSIDLDTIDDFQYWENKKSVLIKVS